VGFIEFFKWFFLKNPGVFLGRFVTTTLVCTASTNFHSNTI